MTGSKERHAYNVCTLLKTIYMKVSVSIYICHIVNAYMYMHDTHTLTDLTVSAAVGRTPGK